jgi:hypothetical protein
MIRLQQRGINDKCAINNDEFLATLSISATLSRARRR